MTVLPAMAAEARSVPLDCRPRMVTDPGPSQEQAANRQRGAKTADYPSQRAAMVQRRATEYRSAARRGVGRTCRHRSRLPGSDRRRRVFSPREIDVRASLEAAVALALQDRNGKKRRR